MTLLGTSRLETTHHPLTGEPAVDILFILRLPVSPEAAGAARHAVGGLGPYLASGVLENTELLVSELVTNSVRHAGLARPQSIELCLRASPEAVLVEVTDPGRGFGGYRPRLDRGARLAADQASGFGLFLVARIAARWGIVENGQTRVWFELRPGVRREREPSPETTSVLARSS